MGVDCTAYENVDLVEARGLRSMSDDDWDRVYDDGNIFLYNLDVFEERGDGLPTGIYRPSEETMRWSRSYGGYNRFRRELCLAVLGVEPEAVWHDYVQYQDRPLAPLMHFADNEGFLGPKTCARLAADAASIDVDVDGWPTWVEMFSLAADTGVIMYT